MTTTSLTRLGAALAVAALVLVAPPGDAATPPYVVTSETAFDIGADRTLVPTEDVVSFVDATASGPSPATPYPSTASVTGAVGMITDVDVVIIGFKHGYPMDADLMLVSPAGTAVTLMSDVGGADPVGSATFTLDDEAATTIPTSSLTGTRYRPTDHEGTLDVDTFPGPAPAEQNTTLSAFDGEDPRGTWKLYAVDDTPTDTGHIVAWSVDVHTTGQSVYPSTIHVTGGPQQIAGLAVGLTGLTHGRSADLDVLLVGPQGQQVTLLSDAGLGENAVAADALVLDDRAATTVGSSVVSGTYRPTDVVEPLMPDTYPAPAPVSTGGTSLAVFDGTDADGDWRLYVHDDSDNVSGHLLGWFLRFGGEKDAPVVVPPVVADTVAPRVTSTTPAARARKVRRGIDVRAGLSEPVRPVTVGRPTAYLVAKGSTRRVRATVGYVRGVVVIDPRRRLGAHTTYRVVLTPGIRDLAGNPLPRTTWRFTTR